MSPSSPLNVRGLDACGSSVKDNSEVLLPDDSGDDSLLDEEEGNKKKTCKDNAESDEYALSDVDWSDQEDCIVENMSSSDSTSLLDSFQDLLYE
eukprot:gene15867-17855_t